MPASGKEGGSASGGIRAVVLAFRVLGFLADSGGERGVTEIARLFHRVTSQMSSSLSHLTASPMASAETSCCS